MYAPAGDQKRKLNSHFTAFQSSSLVNSLTCDSFQCELLAELKTQILKLQVCIIAESGEDCIKERSKKFCVLKVLCDHLMLEKNNTDNDLINSAYAQKARLY